MILQIKQNNLHQHIDHCVHTRSIEADKESMTRHIESLDICAHKGHNARNTIYVAYGQKLRRPVCP